MAGNAVIGALRVVLGLDSAALDKGLKESKSALDSFAKSVASVAIGVGIEKMAENLGRAIGDSFKQAIEFGDKLNKTSQKLGIPVEKLSELKYAADLADVSFESLSKSLVKFDRGIVDAGRGQGQALEAFAAMQINIRDNNGQLKTSSQLLGEVSAKFATYKDSAEKTALAVALFGRAGADMIPLLNQGKEGLEQAAEEARKFGLVLDSDAAKKAEDFNDNLRRLSAVWDGIFIKLMGQSIGVLKEVSSALVRLGSSIDLRPIWESVATTIKEAIAIGYFFVTVIQRIGAEWNALTKIFTSDNAARMAAQAEFVRQGEETKTIFKNLGSNIKAFLSQTTEASKGLTNFGNNAPPALGKVGEGIKKLQGFIDGIVKQTASLNAQAATYDQTAYAAERYRIVQEYLAIAGIKNIDVNSKQYQAILQVADAYAKAKISADVLKSTYDATRTPAEQLQRTIENLNIALDGGQKDWDLYNRGLQQAYQKFAEANPYFQAFEQSVTSAFDKAIDGTQKFSETLKQLLRDLAKAMANAAFKQLLFSGTGGGGGILSGLFGKLFGGGGTPGFASGGSFEVGGSGGIDSQLVQFRATPGEQVNITKGEGTAMGGALTVRVSLDNDLLRAVVQDESGRVVARATPKIVDAATARAVQTVPTARGNNPNYFGR